MIGGMFSKFALRWQGSCYTPAHIRTIRGLDQVDRVVAGRNPLVKDFLPVHRQRVHFERVVLLRGDDLRVDGAQRLGALRGRVANRLVRVQPAPARVDLQAVQVVVPVCAGRHRHIVKMQGKNEKETLVSM